VIDTHCHLLPGLDDGPRTMGESVDLARALANAGVHAVVCTPHYSRLYPTRHSDASATLEHLRDELQQAGITLATTLAAEVSPALALTTSLDELQERSIGGRFLLVELEPDTPPSFPSVLLERLAEGRLAPLLAHPERCRSVQRDPAVLDQARAAGSLVQIVASSLVGRWGRGTARAAWSLLESGRVDLVASDAHGHHRAPDSADLVEAAEEIVRREGRAAYLALTSEHPAAVVRGLRPGDLVVGRQPSERRG
jgi:protein-tyrosine phosphatase